MRAIWQSMMPFFEAEGVGSAGGAPGGDSGSPSGADGAPAGDAPALVAEAGKNAPPGGQGGPQGGEGDKGGDPAVYWPEGLPDDLGAFKGASDRETIDKLAGRLKDAPRPPAKPEDYKLDLPEAFTKRFGDLAGDEVLPIWRQVAHKNGLNDAQFNGAIAELYAEMSTKGLIDEPIDVTVELEKLAPKHGDPVSRKAQASARINGVASNITGLVSRGVLSKTEGNMVLSLAARADGVVALEKLFKAGGEHGLQGGGSGAANASMEDLKAQMGDERYDTRSPKFDKSFRERVDREWRELHNAK